ncbi:3-ketoacyl-CoA thiolase, peroxisomal [Gonapodya sp. JEL0774]|nr:3-ketoacyl-CoA thiolase, peroxisomal [Gonapodya sp. JEL0774]
MATQRVSQVASHLSPKPSGFGRVGIKDMDDIVIVAALRTPITKANKGGFAEAGTEELLAAALEAVVNKAGIDKSLVTDIVVGNVRMPGSAYQWSRVAALYAGFPAETSVYAVNRACSSGLQAVANMAMAIKSGVTGIGIAGGAESMTRVGKTPVADPKDYFFEKPHVEDCLLPMGITSENVAEEFGVSRQKQDDFAFNSYQKAIAAQKNGLFDEEIIPVTFVNKSGQKVTVSKDDGMRPTTREALAKLKPAFKPTGSSTAGNSSQVSDGAAAVLMMKRSRALELGLKVQGKLLSFAAAGVPPRIMGIGPVYAIPKALAQAGVQISDIDIFEINEAFASQAIYCCEKLAIPFEKVNPKGGAIAIGHPVGATGARQVGTLLTELKRTGKQLGVISIQNNGIMDLSVLSDDFDDMERLDDPALDLEGLLSGPTEFAYQSLQPFAEAPRLSYQDALGSHQISQQNPAARGTDEPFDSDSTQIVPVNPSAKTVILQFTDGAQQMISYAPTPATATDSSLQGSNVALPLSVPHLSPQQETEPHPHLLQVENGLRARQRSLSTDTARSHRSGSTPNDPGGPTADSPHGLDDDDDGEMERLECMWVAPSRCDQVFSDPESLYKHLTEDHIGRKPHACTLCKKAFKRPQDLRKHERSHAELKTTLSEASPPPGLSPDRKISITARSPSTRYGSLPVRVKPEPEDDYGETIRGARKSDRGIRVAGASSRRGQGGVLGPSRGSEGGERAEQVTFEPDDGAISSGPNSAGHQRVRSEYSANLRMKPYPTASVSINRPSSRIESQTAIPAATFADSLPPSFAPTSMIGDVGALPAEWFRNSISSSINDQNLVFVRQDESAISLALSSPAEFGQYYSTMTLPNQNHDQVPSRSFVFSASVPAQPQRSMPAYGSYQTYQSSPMITSIGYPAAISQMDRYPVFPQPTIRYLIPALSAPNGRHGESAPISAHVHQYVEGGHANGPARSGAFPQPQHTLEIRDVHVDRIGGLYEYNSGNSRALQRGVDRPGDSPRLEAQGPPQSPRTSRLPELRWTESSSAQEDVEVPRVHPVWKPQPPRPHGRPTVGASKTDMFAREASRGSAIGEGVHIEEKRESKVGRIWSAIKKVSTRPLGKKSGEAPPVVSRADSGETRPAGALDLLASVAAHIGSEAESRAQPIARPTHDRRRGAPIAELIMSVDRLSLESRDANSQPASPRSSHDLGRTPATDKMALEDDVGPKGLGKNMGSTLERPVLKFPRTDRNPSESEIDLDEQLLDDLAGEEVEDWHDILSS